LLFFVTLLLFRNSHCIEYVNTHSFSNSYLILNSSVHTILLCNKQAFQADRSKRRTQGIYLLDMHFTHATIALGKQRV